MTMYQRPLKTVSRFFFNLYARQLLRAYPHYQPVRYRGKFLGGSDRQCRDRWALIKKELVGCHADSLLDLGSAEGFYVLSAAEELGCLSLGVDADVRRFAIAQNQLISEQVVPAGFLLGVVDEGFIKKLPVFDAMLALSLFHHVLAVSGEPHALGLLRLIRTKVGKIFCFEMGQSDEQEHEWAVRLPDMGKDPHGWIKRFLESAGFTNVRKIGESPSYGGSVRRALFTAEP